MTIAGEVFTREFPRHNQPKDSLFYTPEDIRNFRKEWSGHHSLQPSKRWDELQKRKKARDRRDRPTKPKAEPTNHFAAGRNSNPVPRENGPVGTPTHEVSLNPRPPNEGLGGDLKPQRKVSNPRPPSGGLGGDAKPQQKALNPRPPSGGPGGNAKPQQRVLNPRPPSKGPDGDAESQLKDLNQSPRRAPMRANSGNRTSPAKPTTSPTKRKTLFSPAFLADADDAEDLTNNANDCFGDKIPPAKPTNSQAKTAKAAIGKIWVEKC